MKIEEGSQQNEALRLKGCEPNPVRPADPAGVHYTGIPVKTAVSAELGRQVRKGVGLGPLAAGPCGQRPAPRPLREAGTGVIGKRIAIQSFRRGQTVRTDDDFEPNSIRDQ